MTRSTPSISSSGKDNPQSTTTILSPYSNAVIFIPICSKPPNGMIFKLSSNEMLSFFLAGAFLVLTLLVAFFSVVSVSFSVAFVVLAVVFPATAFVVVFFAAGFLPLVVFFSSAVSFFFSELSVVCVALRTTRFAFAIPSLNKPSLFSVSFILVISCLSNLHLNIYII